MPKFQYMTRCQQAERLCAAGWETVCWEDGMYSERHKSLVQSQWLWLHTAAAETTRWINWD